MPLIRSLLIANRGEIARRVQRTCRELGVRAVAVFSEADADAAHVQEADEAVWIGEAAPRESYLRIDRVVDAARRAGADAVHPGYGFLAENADFAEAVEEAGLIWVGPPPSAIRAMGDKARARKVAVEHGVPVVPGWDGEGDAGLREAAAKIGAPLLLKAVSGGGGRGMRRVDDLALLDAAIASARREAESAFGDGRLIVERYVERPRHIEVQILADAHGTVLHLGERECSIQRRHQKVVEEAPSPGVSAALRAAMGGAAVKVAEAVGYVGAGTVEFVLAPDGAFYFLEMNTRLQVEHPVTEAVTGLDLVALQLAVAEGRPLPLDQAGVQLQGHAIEVRLCAEDPVRDFMPATGTLLRCDLGRTAGGEPLPGVRVDGGVRSGDAIGAHYDSMVAKVIAFGPDRRTAARRLSSALDQAWVPGLVTNLPLLREVVRDDAFLAGDLDTSFLVRRDLVRAPPSNLALGAVLAAVIGWWRRRDAAVPAGWSVMGPTWQQDVWEAAGEQVTVQWRAAGDGVEVGVEGSEPEQARVLSAEGDRYAIELDGHVRVVRAAWDGPTITDATTVYLHFGTGEAMVRLVPRFPPPAAAEAAPGSCVAPTPAVVRAVHVSVGDQVEEGAALVTLEAMKMEHVARAPGAGEVVAVRVEVGDSVGQGDLLVQVEV